MRPRRSSLLLMIPVFAILAGCTGHPPEPAAGSEPRPPVEVHAAVDRQKATVGDRLTLTVTVDRAQGFETEAPTLPASIEGLEQVEGDRHQIRETRERVVEAHRFVLAADRVGSWQIPALTVRYRRRPESSTGAPPDARRGPRAETPTVGSTEESRPAGDENPESASPETQGFETAETSPIPIEVESVLEQAEKAGEKVTDIRDLKPLVRPGPEIPWPWILAAAGLIAVLAAFWVWRRRRMREPKTIPTRPAHEVALERIAALAAQDLSHPEAIRRLHFDLSEVVRSYVEARFALNATDLTTEEIVVSLPGLPGLDGDEAIRLKRFLHATDRVKFADHQPETSEIREVLERARLFVEATRPRPEPEEGAEGSKPAGTGDSVSDAGEVAA